MEPYLPRNFIVQETTQRPPAPKKRAQGPLSLNEKIIIANVYDYIRYETPYFTIDDSVGKCSTMTGIGKTTVYKVLKERNVGGIKQPRKYRSKKPTIQNEDVNNAIQKKISSITFKNDIPTVNEVFELIKEDPDIPSMSKSNLCQILNRINNKEKIPNQDDFSTSDRGVKKEQRNDEDCSQWYNDHSNPSKISFELFQDKRNGRTYDDFETKWYVQSDYVNKISKSCEIVEGNKNIEDNTSIKTEIVHISDDEEPISDETFQDMQNCGMENNDFDYKFKIQSDCINEISKYCNLRSEVANSCESNGTFEIEDSNIPLKTEELNIKYVPVNYEYAEVFVKEEKNETSDCEG